MPFGLWGEAGRDLWKPKFQAMCSNFNVLVVRDLYQLPLMHRKPVFINFKNGVDNLCDHWEVSKRIALT